MPPIVADGVFLKTVTGPIFIRNDFILFISAEGKHCQVHTKDERIEVIGTLKEVIERTNPVLFKRVHRQYILNLTHLCYIKYSTTSRRHTAVLDDDDKTEVPVSEIYL
ncbi:hypothetical protein CH373_17710 [Leptospira perolatii]|uniref:HTH LytTR-type domain-containing protein n=2 Tax=Leptospira perolatii TaxID=2023191 RepID=A0A2M9ZI72_9LEPT|nr:hypothetical protein CH360_17285 [Leptospira perolatii]PJZ71756.1 hypothetical protein CH373_17710 [Leptospira perolatii]